MDMLRLGFALISVFLGGIAAFVGVAVTVLALKSGEISISMGRGGAQVGHIARRVSEPSQYWSDLAWFGLVPAVGGALVAWYAWRKLKGR